MLRFSYIFAALLCLVASSTVYDFLKLKGTGKRSDVLVAFSLISNWKHLIRFERSSNEIDCINGLKVLSAFMIIIGHRYSRTEHFVPHTFDTISFFEMLVLNFVKLFVHAVDTFFTISGVLVVQSCRHSFSL